MKKPFLRVSTHAMSHTIGMIQNVTSSPKREKTISNPRFNAACFELKPKDDRFKDVTKKSYGNNNLMRSSI
jgi:hypothetical protein